MHGQNFLFNQPLAIDSNYLMSLLPAIALGYRNNSFESTFEMEKRVFSGIKSQMDTGINTGADQFPVVFNITGPIVKYSDWYYIGTQTMMRWLAYLDADPRVSGIVFNIDSGGGMVSGTAEFADFIKNMQKQTISWTNDYQCSAAEWIASGCDYKMAGPHASDIGSIGTLIGFQDFSALFEKYGATIYEIYAPESTEKNKDFRELIGGNRKPMEAELSKITQKFIKNIQENYNGLIQDDGSVFKGKTYDAEEALKIGLIQEIGSLEEAMSKF